MPTTNTTTTTEVASVTFGGEDFQITVPGVAAPAVEAWMLDSAAESLRTLDRWIARWDRWERACQQARNGDDTAWRKMRAPSKTSKHRAYGDANHAARLLGLNVRPNTVAELRLFSATAKADIAARRAEVAR